MACGCGGECCKQPKGIGFLSWGGNESADEDIYGDYDYLYDYGGSYGGGAWWNDLTQTEYDYLFGSYGWGDPNTVYNTDFVDRQESEKGGEPLSNAWQQLLDWWNELTGGYRPNVPIPGPEPNAPSTLPPFSGYCPPNTYCADFPTCSQCLPIDNSRAAKAAAAAHKAAQAAAAKAAAQKQQAAKPCPPNTGLVKNAQGQCVCPPSMAFSKTYGKCVMASQLTAKDKEDAQAPDWLKWAIAAGIVVVGVKVLQDGKGK